MQTTIVKTIANAEHDGERRTEEGAGGLGENALAKNNRTKFIIHSGYQPQAPRQFESLTYQVST